MAPLVEEVYYGGINAHAVKRVCSDLAANLTALVGANPAYDGTSVSLLRLGGSVSHTLEVVVRGVPSRAFDMGESLIHRLANEAVHRLPEVYQSRTTVVVRLEEEVGTPRAGAGSGQMQKDQVGALEKEVTKLSAVNKGLEIENRQLAEKILVCFKETSDRDLKLTSAEREVLDLRRRLSTREANDVLDRQRIEELRDDKQDLLSINMELVQELEALKRRTKLEALEGVSGPTPDLYRVCLMTTMQAAEGDPAPDKFHARTFVPGPGMGKREAEARAAQFRSLGVEASAYQLLPGTEE